MARVLVCGAPRLHWMLLEDFDGLKGATLDPRDAVVRRVHVCAPLCVTSRCRYSLMGCGMSELAPDGTLCE